MATARAGEDHGDERGLILTCTHSTNLERAAEAPSLKITSYRTSLRLSRRSSQSTRE